MKQTSILPLLDEEGWKLGVISRLLSGASANPRCKAKISDRL